MKKNNQKNQLNISDKALLKEKVCYTISSGLFIMGALSYCASFVFGLAGVLKPFQMLASIAFSFIPTAVAFGVGVAGTPVERGVEDITKVSEKEINQPSQERDDCKDFEK